MGANSYSQRCSLLARLYKFFYQKVIIMDSTAIEKIREGVTTKAMQEALNDAKSSLYRGSVRTSSRGDYVAIALNTILLALSVLLILSVCL
jgi:hypothetical protein